MNVEGHLTRIMNTVKPKTNNVVYSKHKTEQL